MERTPVNYIATWFYKESNEEASFYPQMGSKGSSALAHSVYMEIQVPFFVTFRHYNPEAKFLFFTNLKPNDLPPYLLDMFEKLQVEIISLPYTSRPPRNWYAAWQNQFYLYDILTFMQNHRMQPNDVLLISDADCLCRTSLAPLFDHARRDGSALYEFITDEAYVINGITLPQMNEFYQACYGEQPKTPITYYGGEFIVLREDAVRMLNEAFPSLWTFNLQRGEQGKTKLNEEAHVLSILAERLQIRNQTANRFVKRMWTTPDFNNVVSGDECYPVWHLPYEKKRGLHYLYRLLSKDLTISDENIFWKKAGRYTGIPTISLSKRIKDCITRISMKLR